MRWNRLRTTKWGIALLLTMGFVFAQQAGAVPPPPSFFNFTISNELPGNVTELELKFYKTTGPHHDQLDPTPLVMMMPSLPNDTEVVLSLPSTNGIAKIEATAHCPGSPAPKTVMIEGPLGDHSQPPDGQPEYACFCYQAPRRDPPVPNYAPGLEFKNQGGQNVIRLHGKYRWGNVWPDLPVEMVLPCD